MLAAVRWLLVVVAFSLGLAAAQAQDFFLDLDTGGHRAFVKDLAFSADGETLVSASDDKTIRVWDWKSGLSLRTLRGQVGDGNEGKVFAVAISPDGRTVAAGGYFGPGLGETPPYGDVRLFDVATGKIKAVLKGAEYAVYDLAYSPDGKLLAAGGQDGFVYLWRRDDAAPDGWTADTRIDADSNRISQVGFAAGGSRLVATTADNGIRLWDMGSREEIALPETAEALRDIGVPALAISGDGALFATGTADGQISVWRASDGAVVQTLPRQDFSVGTLTFANGAKTLVASCGYRCTDTYRTVVWEVGKDAPAREYREHDGTVVASAATPDGVLVATAGGQRHAIHVWDPLTGETKKVLQGNGQPVTAVGIDAKSFAIGWGSDNPCADRLACPEVMGALTRLLGLPSPERYFESPQALTSDVGAFNRASLSRGGWSLRAAAGGDHDLDNAILDVVRDGNTVHEIENDATNGYLHGAFTLIDGGKRLITGGSDGTLVEYESASGTFAGEFSGGHTGEINAVAAEEKAGLLVTGSADQTVRLWNLKTRELIVSLYFDDADWVAWMPQGYYYASDNGDERFGWQVNQGQDREGRFVRAGQLKTFLWSPEMVRRAIILKSAKAAVAEMRPGAERELQRLLERKPPEFQIKLADDQSNVREGFVAIEILGAKEAETAVSDFAILSNSRNVGDLAERSVSGDEKRTIIQVPISEGENEIRITGANAQGYITERSVRALGTKRKAEVQKGRLYVAVIGVNKYPQLPDACNGRSCDLRFPVDDATGFLAMIEKKTAPLFSGMEALVLVNREVLEDKSSSGYAVAGLDAVLEPDSDTISDQLQDFLDQPGPDDTSIVFVAGHGINIDEDYYFIPTDGRKQDADRWRRSSLVEWSDIQKAVERAKGVRFMMLDTCHAANAFNPRLEKDAADARIVVFSATAANNTALELAELGHGVFTYSLLQGLGGKAKTSDAGVTLFGLADYVGREVDALTGSRQKPAYYVGGVENLLLAQP
jgi:uncharacterized caspase-like protein